MTKLIVLLAGAMFVCLSADRLRSAGQTAALPKFEVATIKPTRSQGQVAEGRCHGVDSKYSATAAASAPPLGRCRYTLATLRSLVFFAYRESPEQNPTILGAEGWMTSELYDIEAKADDPATATEAQMKLMLQSLLREQFHLEVHVEVHEEPGFALHEVPSGAKLKATAGAEPKPGGLNQTPMGGTVILPDNGGRLMKGNGLSMARLANFVGGILGRPVENKTDLNGLYDVTLNWTPEVGESIGPASGNSTDPAGPSFVTAVREQWGLRLDSEKVPVHVLVIDHAEKPPQN